MKKVLLAAILLFAPPCYGAAAFVQSKYNAVFSGTTIAFAMDSNVTSGNLLVGFVGWDTNTVTLDSVAKTAGTCTVSFTLLNNPTTQGGSRGATFYAYNISGGSCTITATFSGSISEARGFIHEASGLATATDPKDQNTCNGQNTPGTGTDAVTSTAVTTTANGEYIFGGTYTTSGNPAPGTGYTQPADRSTVVQDEYQIQTSAGSIAATFTSDTGFGNWVTCIVTFKVPAAAGVARRRIISQ